MITKKEICNVLKDIINDDTIKILPNRISNKDEKAICVEDSNLLKQIAIKESTRTFNQISFRINIRYSTNETETEDFCRDLYEKIKNISYYRVNDKNVWLQTIAIEEPYATGSVKNNIYEQRIEFGFIYSINKLQ